MRLLAVALLSVFLVSCDEDEGEESSDSIRSCSCLIPKPGGSVVHCPNEYDGYQEKSFTANPGTSCKDAIGSLGCCAGTIKSSWRQTDSLYAVIPALRTTTVSYAPNSGQSLLRPVNLNSDISCTVECSKPYSPYCAKIENSDETPLRKTLELIATRFGAAEPKVSKPEIMEAFGITNDPCNRSDLTRDGNSIGNTSDACTVQSSLSIGGTSMHTVSAYLPETVRGQLLLDESGSTVAFDDSYFAPQLSIEGYLNADYGGTVSRISHGPGGIVVRTSNGCIGL